MSSELAQWTLGKLVSSAIPPDLTERKKIVRLGLPRIIRLKRKRSRTRLQLVLCDDWHGKHRLPCCAGFSRADQGSHSHPRGDFAPYRALFSVSCGDPY